MKNSFEEIMREIHILQIKRRLLNALLFCAIALLLFFVVLVGTGAV